MYLESPPEFRLKKARHREVVMDHIGRGDNNLNVRRREFGTQIHSISGSFDKISIGGSRGVPRYGQSVQHGRPHISDTIPNCSCATCVDLFNEFCETSSFHGLKYVGDKKLHFLERLFWLVSFILAMLTAGYFISSVYEKWSETPVIVSIGARTTPMVDIPFPAVTICTMNEVRRSEALNINKSTDGNSTMFRRMLQDACNNTEKDTGTKKWSNSSDSWENILNFMLKVRQPCHEMVKACYYAGNVENCTNIFNPSLTDEGICCSFNKVERQYIFRNPRNLSDLNVTFPMPTVDWNPEIGYPPGTPIGTLPWRPRGAGSHLGLTVVLDVESDQFYCSTSASIGFKLLLHNPVETPKIADYGSLIAPGREYRVEIRPTINNSTKSLHNVREEDRQCTFSEDQYLQYYRTYTQRNCILECESNYTLSVCNCVPYYLPKDVTTPICGKEEESCARKARKLLEMMMVNNSNLTLPGDWHIPNCVCLPGCNELSYSSSMTYGSMDSSFVVNKGYLDDTVNTSETKKNFAIVHLYFTETKFLNYYKTELFGLSEFLSSTGGLLGLFFGFSFLSAVEVLYFATTKLIGGILGRFRKGRPVPPYASHQMRAHNMVNNYPFLK